MSTRSGRRIHLSFHENTIKSEAEIPKSERKTRSKHTKENLEELQPIPKAKKRNYVAYPGDNVIAVDTVDGKDEGRTTRALRKNALKERNCGSPTEVADPSSGNKTATDLTRSVRSTRRTRKFPENIEDAPESIPQDEQLLPKPKKDKKKNKKAENEEIEEEALSKQQKVDVEVKAVPKKKSKKKKGRGSGSIVVEDILPEAPSALNKSTMSVDSFHSAAGSPRKTDNEADKVQKDEDIDKFIEVRKTSSSSKPDISSNHEESEKQQRRRKSSAKMVMDASEDADKGEESIIRISKSRDTLLLPVTKDEEINSTFDVDEKKNTSTRKSRRSTFDKTITPRKVTIFDKETNNTNKTFDITVIANEAIEPAEENVNTIEKDVNIESVKGKRKSAINATTQITNKPTPKKIYKKKSIVNYLFENNVEAIVPEDKSLFDGTYSYISADNSSPITQSGENMNKTVDTDLIIESVKGKRKSAINATPQMSHNNNITPRKSFKRKSIAMDTSENNFEAKVLVYNKSIFDSTYITAENSSPISNKQIEKSIVNTTFDKELEPSSELEIETKKSETFDLTSSPFKSAYEVSSPVRMDDVKRKSVIFTTVGKDDSQHVTENYKSTDNKNTTSEKELTQETQPKKNKNKRTSSPSLSSNVHFGNNSTFEIDQDKKLYTTFDKHSKSSILTSDSSMITLDKSNGSRISITSDESKNEENILNATPMLIESSLDESAMDTTQTKVTTPVKNDTTVSPITPLKREGTFTKDETEVINSPNTTQTKVTTPVKNVTTVSPITPLKREGTFTKDETEDITSPKPRVSRTPTKRMSLPSPGYTPFHINKSSSKEKSALLNITRSIEKRRCSLLEPPRTTKVMFCSPVNNQAVVNQIKKKVIKSNLKGSNKSFVFDESASVEPRPATRKRSYTHSEADEARAKRKRLATDLQQSVNRLSRPRTSSASAKLAEPTTPSKKSESKIFRTKLPNFTALHQRGFDRMESLNQCQERKARRARKLLTPTGAVAMLDRISPKEKTADQEKPPEKSKDASEKRKETTKSKEAPKPDTPIKSLPTFKSLNPGYTRFGFKLNLDVNPFSITSQPATKAVNAKPKENKPNRLARQATLPSLAGATSVRREMAKQTVMREKSFTDRRNETRTVNRTVIKGVRTNRRFELQMKMRDI